MLIALGVPEFLSNDQLSKVITFISYNIDMNHYPTQETNQHACHFPHQNCHPIQHIPQGHAAFLAEHLPQATMDPGSNPDLAIHVH